MPNPTVSVVIPARNSASFIVEAVESVYRQIGYSFEVIVVDHASTDETSSLVEKINRNDVPDDLRIVKAPEGGGPSRAKNVGLSQSTGEFITFLDSDDIRVDESIEQQMKVLLDHPEAGSVFGRIAGLMDSAGTPIMDKSFYSWIAACNALNRDRGCITPDRIAVSELPGYFTLLYRKSLIDSVGKFDETLPQAEDFDFAYRCALKAPMLFLDSPCVFYRVHSKNLSIEKDSTGRAVPRPETKIAHNRALKKHGL